MLNFLSYKSKFALCVAGAVVGFALCAYGLSLPSAPIDFSFLLHPLAYFGMVLNLLVAAAAMLLSCAMLVIDLSEQNL